MASNPLHTLNDALQGPGRLKTALTQSIALDDTDRDRSILEFTAIALREYELGASATHRRHWHTLNAAARRVWYDNARRLLDEMRLKGLEVTL